MLDYTTLSIILLYGVQCLSFTEGKCNGSVKQINVDYEGMVIRFPESGVYERNLYCEWLITSMVEERIVFQTRDVQISQGDAYYVYDGRNENGTVLHDMVYTSGSAFSHSLAVSSNPNLFLKFTSDNQSNSAKDKGFTFYIISAKEHSNCTIDTKLQASDVPKIITSPLFPEKYQSNTDCTWHISTDNPDDRIVIDVHFLDVEKGKKCFDTLTINTGSSYALCGSDDFLPNKTYVGIGNVTVIFKSDDVQNENGFIISYREEDITTQSQVTSTFEDIITTQSQVTTTIEDITTTQRQVTSTFEDETTPPNHTSTVMNTYMATDGKDVLKSPIGTSTSANDSSMKNENITGKSKLKNDDHRGLITGIVLAICAALVITVLVLFVTCRQRRKRKLYFNDTKKEPFLDTERVQPDPLAFENTNIVITGDVADEGTKIPMSALVANDDTDMKTNGNLDIDTTVEDRHKNKNNAESGSKETKINEDRDTKNIHQEFTNEQETTGSEEDDTKIIVGKDTATEENGMKISGDTETNTNEGKTPPSLEVNNIGDGDLTELKHTEDKNMTHKEDTM